jgi:hypothetical protein
VNNTQGAALAFNNAENEVFVTGPPSSSTHLRAATPCRLNLGTPSGHTSVGAYTKAATGSPCYWNTSHHACAACFPGGCQCGPRYQHRCAKCGTSSGPGSCATPTHGKKDLIFLEYNAATGAVARVTQSGIASATAETAAAAIAVDAINGAVGLCRICVEHVSHGIDGGRGPIDHAVGLKSGHPARYRGLHRRLNEGRLPERTCGDGE